MGYTKGNWEHTEDGCIIAADGKQIASVFPRDQQGNSNLIVEAVNACISLDNEQPLFVSYFMRDKSGTLRRLYEAYKQGLPKDGKGKGVG